MTSWEIWRQIWNLNARRCISFIFINDAWPVSPKWIIEWNIWKSMPPTPWNIICLRLACFHENFPSCGQSQLMMTSSASTVTFDHLSKSSRKLIFFKKKQKSVHQKGQCTRNRAEAEILEIFKLGPVDGPGHRPAAHANHSEKNIESFQQTTATSWASCFHGNN